MIPDDAHRIVRDDEEPLIINTRGDVIRGKLNDSERKAGLRVLAVLRSVTGEWVPWGNVDRLADPVMPLVALAAIKAMGVRLEYRGVTDFGRYVRLP